MITVYHSKGFNLSNVRQTLGTEDIAQIDADQFFPVAIANTDSLEIAYSLVQHAQRLWQQHPQVWALERGQKRRSTGYGDLLQKQDGTCWLVTTSGFKHIESLKLPESNEKPKFQKKQSILGFSNLLL